MWQAYTPWPGIFTLYGERRLLLERVGYDRIEHHEMIGTVEILSHDLVRVFCGQGALTLFQVKLE
jgi:methionyl-tRNA formyltransferase